jgi:hypothetical protein
MRIAMAAGERTGVAYALAAALSADAANVAHVVAIEAGR